MHRTGNKRRRTYKQFARLIDELDTDKLGIRQKFEEEMARVNRFQSSILGTTTRHASEQFDVDIRNYAKYLLREGTMIERRELLKKLRSNLLYNNKTISLTPL